METVRYDVVTIGGGPGATPGAELLARHGKRVAVVEQGPGLGGTCLFEGCIPSKIFLETARRLRMLDQAERFGIKDVHHAGPDRERLLARKREILAVRANGAENACRRLGIDLWQGTADFLDDHRVIVHQPQGDRVLEAAYIIAAPGSVSRPLDPGAVEGGDLAGIWSSADALELPEIPGQLVIVGGGYIGVELATLFAALGSRVRLLEVAPRLLLTEDPEVAEHVRQYWAKGYSPNGAVTVETGVTLTALRATSLPPWTVEYRNAHGNPERLGADRVLVAIGRIPNTAGLAWEKAGITLGPQGEVPVNAFGQTVVAHIYAPGDVNGRVMLAHAATRQSLLAARHILGQPEEDPVSVVPHVIFSHPEIAAVGADRRDLITHPDWRVTVWPYRQDARALILGDRDGFAQMIWDARTHAVRGLQIVGEGAGELVEEATYAITHGGTLESLVAAIHPHPTLNEVVSELAAEALLQANP